MLQLFEISTTRSRRVKWTLLELGVPYESITGKPPEFFQLPALRGIHPMGKVPAVAIDGKGLFESAAICTYLADQSPEKGLSAASGTWDRGLHDQWTSFVLTEMEAWAWSTFRSTNIVADDQKVPEMYDYNKAAYREGAAVLNDVLGKCQYLIQDKFSVTDIIVSWTCHFGQNLGYIDDFDNIAAYLERVKCRPLCTLEDTSTSD